MRQMHLQLRPKRLLPTLLLLVPVPAAFAAPAPTRTAVAATGATLAAEVRTATGEPVSSGTVDFLLPSGQSLGSALVSANGTATLPLSSLPAATGTGLGGTPTLPITAAYTATSDAFADSASTPTPIPAPKSEVAAASPEAATTTPDFIVTGVPTTVTTPKGAYGTTTITVASVGGYAGAIQLSCTGLPAQVTCIFNPTQQTLAPNGSFTTTLQLETQGPSGTASSSLLPPGAATTLAFAFPGTLLLFGFTRRRQGFLRNTALLGATFMLTAGALSGCSQRYGYLHHPPPVAGGTPSGTFPITVVVDGNQSASVVEHNLAISLVVQ